MLDDQKSKLLEIENFLKKQKLSIDIFKSVSKKTLKNSNNISNSYNEYGQSYDSINSCFLPTMEEVAISNIDGIVFEEGNLLESMSKIYRFDDILNNLGKFDITKFNKSLNNSNYELMELDGKYYVCTDGNHRTLLMLFQYYMGLTNMLQNNYSPEEIENFKRNATINAPVIHLKHNHELINLVSNINLKSSRITGYQSNFVKENSNKKYKNNNCFLKYDKNKNSYFAYYNGFSKDNLSSEDAINFFNHIENFKLDNSIMMNDNSYLLHNKHIGVKNIPSNQVYNVDKSISKLKLKDIGIDYFINVDLKNKKIDLNFFSKDYYKSSPDFDKINKFLDNNKELFSSNTKDTTLFDSFKILSESRYENISMSNAIELIKKMDELDKLIQNEPIKKSNR